MSKQKSLAAFGFSKTITHRGVSTRVFIPENVEVIATINCNHCSMMFKTRQALAVHTKCKHSSFEPAQKKAKFVNETVSVSKKYHSSHQSAIQSQNVFFLKL